MPTHGSLTKAGKVRNQTPQIKSTKKGKSQSPIRSKHQQYKRLLANPNPFRRRRRRRR